jgi:hypothetical protein
MPVKVRGTAPANRGSMNIKFCTAPVSHRLRGWKRLSRRIHNILTVSLVIQFDR